MTPTILSNMRTDEALAKWRAAASLFEQKGSEGAVATLRSWVGHGLSEAEAELLIHHVQQLAREAEATDAVR